ncbi:TIGR00730 family Rossman fold protein [Rhodohalobacter sulfatireducens]|uniref:Cytokinin riboside 5'-monophosphate phosphoribohydrolase n=1 Tax=Rhodohalobacter sulfatireducens TaxID=2911366 RepID=A0ABS9KDW7_9BACT|nr:TIGR00730 family Rossman fold protein [Rhodohalobacter sulfatireducens]MCG2589021.1 TIGR00730 family Rossman fold protein [Rhodohalobacter sulfatireducens]
MNICVYCGSSSGKDPAIEEEATKLGELMCQREHNLVYGGASRGIMGILADSVMQNGGEVVGVIPKNLFQKEVAHQGITKLIAVDGMHQRKSIMADRAEAFIALPGGFGTLEELFEIITWNQIGLINKPVVVYNFNGYFDSLINMIDHAVEVGFIRPKNRKILQVAETLEECLRFCESVNKM